MAKLDIENLCGKLETFLKANLNTRLAAIDAEKNDGITLRQIDSNAYHFQTMDDKEVAYNPYVFYGLVDITTDGTGPGTSKTYQVDVMVIMAKPEDATGIKRILRYQRALEEIVSENYDQIRSDVKVAVTSVAPAPVRDLDNGEFYLVTGVQLRLTLY